MEGGGQEPRYQGAVGKSRWNVSVLPSGLCEC
jgi:hypothetical protein